MISRLGPLWTACGSAVRKLTVSDRGLVLPMVLMVMVVGSITVGGFLVLTSTISRVQQKSTDASRRWFAADAAVDAVIGDLARGADALAVDYPVPNIQVNGISMEITISAPSGVIPTPEFPVSGVPPERYNDPGLADPDNYTVKAGAGYLMHLYNVKEGTLQVNWAVEQPAITRIGVWQGRPIDPQTELPYPPGKINVFPVPPPLVETVSNGAGATNNLTDPLLIGGVGLPEGIYTIMFDNTTGDSDVVALPFSTGGGLSSSWIFAAAYKDYFVTAADAEGVILNVYLRQMPGPVDPPVGPWTPSNVSFMGNKVLIECWCPP